MWLFPFSPLFVSYQQNNVDNVIEAAKAICSVLCFVETRDITDAVGKLHALGRAQVKDARSCPTVIFKTGNWMGITTFLIDRVHFTLLLHFAVLFSLWQLLGRGTLKKKKVLTMCDVIENQQKICHVINFNWYSPPVLSCSYLMYKSLLCHITYLPNHMISEYSDFQILCTGWQFKIIFQKCYLYKKSNKQ